MAWLSNLESRIGTLKDFHWSNRAIEDGRQSHVFVSLLDVELLYTMSPFCDRGLKK